MSDYANKPDAKSAAIDRPRGPIPPAPKPKPPMVAKAVPTVEDLISPSGPVSTVDVSSGALLQLAANDLDAIYGQLERALAKTLAALSEPPPPADRPFALSILAGITETLAALVVGHLGHGLMSELKRRQLSEASLETVKDQLKPISSAAARGANSLVTHTGAQFPGAAADPAGVADPSSSSLLAEFGTRLENELGANKAAAKNQIVLAMDHVQTIRPVELQSLTEGLAAYARDHRLGAWFQKEATVAWLNFSATIARGERKPGESFMPDANRRGGSRSPDWRRPYSGFIEIEVDLPEQLSGVEGVTLGSIRVAAQGPGAERILAASEDPSKADANKDVAARGRADVLRAFGAAESKGLSLHTLPVFRRLWLGTTRFDRRPDILITPDNKLEINASSALLAAIGTGKRARSAELVDEGDREESEEARLVWKLRQPRPPQSNETGRLGTALANQSRNVTTPEEDLRLPVVAINNARRPHDARLGGEKIVADVLSRATTENIAE